MPSLYNNKSINNILLDQDIVVFNDLIRTAFFILKAPILSNNIKDVKIQSQMLDIRKYDLKINEKMLELENTDVELQRQICEELILFSDNMEELRSRGFFI